MPAMLLSGFAFPIRNMPEFVQYLTYLNPIRYARPVSERGRDRAPVAGDGSPGPVRHRHPGAERHALPQTA